MIEDLTKSPNIGVRWQAEMEDHLRSVRQLTHESLIVPPEAPAATQRALLAQAQALAAVALALANAGSDLEGALSGVGDAIAALDR